MFRNFAARAGIIINNGFIPSFYRDFIKFKSLNNHGIGPNISFIREEGNATYFDANGVMQLASEGQPRFDHDPVTLESRGLLIEESRSNLLLRSAEFNDSAWNKTSDPVTVTANQIASPDGTLSADLIAGTSDNDRHLAQQAVSGATAGTQYTMSIFVKAGTQRYIVFGDGGDSVWRLLTFDFNTLSISHSLNLTSSSATLVGNGWYRLIATATRSNTSNYNIVIGFSNAGTNSSPPVYIESADDTFYVWGAQLEQDAFATSYIPTSGATATRNADSAVVTPISSFYNASEGTLFAEYRTGNGTPTSAVFVIDDGTNDNRVGLFTSTTAQVAIAASFNSFGDISPFPNTEFKSAMGYKANDHAASANGAAAVSPDTPVGVPSGLTTLVVGAEFGGQFAQLCGHIRKVAYYPKRLSNATLEALAA